MKLTQNFMMQNLEIGHQFERREKTLSLAHRGNPRNYILPIWISRAGRHTYHLNQVYIYNMMANELHHNGPTKIMTLSLLLSVILVYTTLHV